MFKLFKLIPILFLVCFCVSADGSEHESKLTKQIYYFKEASSQPLSIEQAKKRFDSGAAYKADSNLLAFGTGSDPVWVHVVLEYRGEKPVQQRLTTGTTWTDNLNIYHFKGEEELLFSHLGDRQTWNENILPGVGIVQMLNVPVGQSDLFIRAETPDPLVLPLEFMPLSQTSHHDTLTTLMYGLFYGVLLTLIAYNLVLYGSFKQEYFALYSVYISSFLFLNAAYNGYGFAFLYPNSLELQNFVILNLMVIHGVMGLVFAIRFLSLKITSSALYKTVVGFIAFGLAFISISTFLGAQYIVATFAFAYLSISSLLMITVGIMHFNRVDGAKLFVYAIAASMFGVTWTIVNNMGLVPYTNVGYHAAEVGVLIEAHILAYALYKQLKAHQTERLQANYIASYDPLTAMLNRRAFKKLGNDIIEDDVKHDRHTCLIMMDLDHFKSINDQYGHQAGDAALIHVAKQLKNNTRERDLIARYGGEEMIILLPDIEISQATIFTERLRKTLEENSLSFESHPIQVTASFGVAQLSQGETLVDLIERADKHLYQAKEQGRNCVVSVSQVRDINVV